MKERLYRLLAARVPGIRDRYAAWRLGARRSRWQSMLYLLWLNLQYVLFFHRGWGRPEETALYEDTPLYAGGGESSLSLRDAPEAFAAKLAAFDAVSFDVFDTLVFRPFSHPTDLFYLVGRELGYPDFRRLRIQAEERAREKKWAESGTREVTLEEIWALLAAETGIPMETGLQAEWNLEMRCCFANPYMLPVVETLRRAGKPLLAASDMYLGEERLRSLLESCGYSRFDHCFVSCDHGRSKSDGGLYPLVLQTLGPGRSLAHVGDNEHADLRQAERYGLHPFLYPNVHHTGGRYRAKELSAVTGSLYRGIVNAHLHNGLSAFSREYEYGFVYGGLFVAGYCRFIHALVQARGIEKILFLSRDGALLIQAYRRMYPEETGNTAYAAWSRLAAAKLTAGYYKQDYFRRFLYHKADQGFSLRRILESMELPGLLEPLCRSAGMNPDDELTHKNAGKVKSYLCGAWDAVLGCYAEQVAAGEAYYRTLLAGCRSAAAVDIGWAGSGALTLDCAVNRLWGLDCPIMGILAGTNSARSPEPDASAPFFLDGKLEAYLYSDRENRDLWKFHDPAQNHNLYWELLLGAPEGSLIGFYPGQDGKPRLHYKAPPPQADRIREIHQGALDFVDRFLEIEKRLGLAIPVSGRDAYAPMLLTESRRNKKFMEGLEALMDEMHIG